MKALAGVGPLLEVGAGTGYWASLLRQAGVSVTAVDSHPPGAQSGNLWHKGIPAMTEVTCATHNHLAAAPMCIVMSDMAVDGCCNRHEISALPRMTPELWVPGACCLKPEGYLSPATPAVEEE